MAFNTAASDQRNAKAELNCSRCPRLVCRGLEIIVPFTRVGRDVVCEICELRHLLERALAGAR